MDPALSLAQFDSQFNSLRPALVANARERIGQDAEDVAGQLYLVARAHLESFNAETGAQGFARWLHFLLRQRIVDHVRASRARNRLIDPRGLDATTSAAEQLGSTLESDDARAALTRSDLRHELKHRLRYTHLSEQERDTLVSHANGASMRAIAKREGCTATTIWRRIHRAINKLKSCPMSLSCADADHYIWRLGTQVTIYRRPITLGTRLATERLKRLR